MGRSYHQGSLQERGDHTVGNKNLTGQGGVGERVSGTARKGTEEEGEGERGCRKGRRTGQGGRTFRVREGTAPVKKTLPAQTPPKPPRAGPPSPSPPAQPPFFPFCCVQPTWSNPWKKNLPQPLLYSSFCSPRPLRTARHHQLLTVTAIFK